VARRGTLVTRLHATNGVHRSIDRTPHLRITRRIWPHPGLFTQRYMPCSPSLWISSRPSRSNAVVSRSVSKARRDVSLCAGSAHHSHASGAALSCEPRAAPTGASCWHAPRQPCDHFGYRPDESRTPRPTTNHRARAVPMRTGARPCRQPARRAEAPTASRPHAVSPVCETEFDICASTWQSAPTSSPRHAPVISCLQTRRTTSVHVRRCRSHAPHVRQRARTSGAVAVFCCCTYWSCPRLVGTLRLRVPSCGVLAGCC
jgi:hypothetical protein